MHHQMFLKAMKSVWFIPSSMTQQTHTGVQKECLELSSSTRLVLKEIWALIRIQGALLGLAGGKGFCTIKLVSVKELSYLCDTVVADGKWRFSSVISGWCIDCQSSAQVCKCAEQTAFLTFFLPVCDRRFLGLTDYLWQQSVLHVIRSSLNNRGGHRRGTDRLSIQTSLCF